MPPSPLLTPEHIAELQGLQLRARTVVESVLAGTHRSTRRGFSVEFAEHRDYVPGDDLRYIDWKLFARRDRYFVRQFEDETRFKLLCAVDVSQSMTYRSAATSLSKLDYAGVLAASLLWLVQQQRDEFGLATFSSAIHEWLPPTVQSGWLQQIVSRLEAALENARQLGMASMVDVEATLPPPEVDWQAIHDVIERVPPRSLIVLFTDGFGDVDTLGRALQHAQHRRQDLRLIHILDEAEVEFPFQEPTRFLGLETAERIALPARSIRESYLVEFQEFLRLIESTCRERHCTYQRMLTTTPLNVALRHIVNGRP